MNNETVDDLSGRQTKLSAETEEFYRARLIRYTGWQHSAMIIRPGVEDYINIMVSCDPLYLVDTRHELLKPAIALYNETYQRRLRPYVISEQSDRKILGQLPNGQFGLVFAHNFFNFRPFEIMRQWLTEIYQKLKPGGMLLMTINDCDRYKAVISVENRFCCYTPGYLVLELAQSLGFEIVFTWHDNGPITWLELKRPGELTSVRGGQSLAKIMPKIIPPTDEELEAAKQQRLEQLRYRAIANGVSKEELTDLTADQLEQLNINIEQVRYNKK